MRSHFTLGTVGRDGVKAFKFFLQANLVAFNFAIMMAYFHDGNIPKFLWLSNISITHT